MKPALVIAGHRGAMNVMPENSIASFRYAQEAGADEIELDVQLSRDGIPIVLHDETLDRTAGSDSARNLGPVAEMTFQDLRAAILDSGFPVLTLEEAYDATRITIQLEIKAVKAVPAALSFLRSRPHDAQRTLFTSYHPEALVAAAELAPDMSRGLILESYPSAQRFPNGIAAELERTGASLLYCGWEGLTAETVATMHAAGYAVRVWTVTSVGDMRRARQLGVDGVVANDPAQARRWFNELAEGPSER